MDFKEIASYICSKEGYSFDEINVKSQKRELVTMRYLIMKMANDFTDMTLEMIGKEFAHGGDHSNVLHGCKQIANLYDTNQDWKWKIDTYKSHFVEMKKRQYLFIPNLPDMVDFRKIRATLKISQRRVEREIDISQPYLSKLELGIRGSHISYERVKMLLNYYRSVAIEKDIPFISY